MKNDDHKNTEKIETKILLKISFSFINADERNGEKVGKTNNE